jgi:anti-sigma factor RsiW
VNHLGDALHAYLDGELEPGPRAAADAHLRDCADCRARLEEMRTLAAALKQDREPDPGALYWDQFAARVEARLPDRRPARVAALGQWLAGWLFAGDRFAWGRALGAVAVCTVLVYVGMRGFLPSPARMTLETSPRQPPATQSAPSAAAPESPPTALAPQKAETQDEREVQATAPRDEATTGAAARRRSRAAPSSLGGEKQKSAPPTLVLDEVRPPAEGREVESPGVAQQVTATAGTTDEVATMRTGAPQLVPRPLTNGFAAGRSDQRRPPPGIAAQLRKQETVPPAALAPIDSAAGADSWLALDARIWPQRAAPEVRPTLVRIASGLALHPEDARAARRTREYFSWLAATSPSDSERTHWEARLRTLPPR